MKSAITLNPKDASYSHIVGAFECFIVEVQLLSEAIGRKASILLQHSLKHDKFAVSVTLRKRGRDHSFYATADRFVMALAKVNEEVRRVRLRINDAKHRASLEAKKPTSRAARGGRSRRESPTRKRSA